MPGADSGRASADCYRLGPGRLASPPLVNPGAQADAKAQIESSSAIAELLTDAAKKLNEKKDGTACLENLARAFQLDPKYRDNAVVRMIRPRCLMRAGRCDEGSRDMRDHFAAEDTGHRKTDEQLDEDVREWANRECSAAEAKNAADRSLRIMREMDQAFPKDAKTCEARFDELAKELPGLARKDRFERNAWSRGIRQLPRLVTCVAEAGECKRASALFERYFVIDHPTFKDPQARAKKEWPTYVKRQSLSCP